MEWFQAEAFPTETRTSTNLTPNQLRGDKLSKRSDNHTNLAIWFGAMAGCYAAMSECEKDSLHQWEESNNDGITGTSHWPGWDKYISEHRPENFAIPSRTAKQPISGKVRMEVFSRDGFRCKKCGSLDRLSVDHIIPESKGGAHEVSNFQTLCKSCNSKKGARA